jgi:hypothetical protein
MVSTILRLLYIRGLRQSGHPIQEKTFKGVRAIARGEARCIPTKGLMKTLIKWDPGMYGWVPVKWGHLIVLGAY